MIGVLRKRYSVVLGGDAHAALVRAASPQPCVCVRDRDELLSETARRGAVAFVDVDQLHLVDREVSEVYAERRGAGAYEELVYELARDTITVPVVGILDAPAADVLPETVRTLAQYPWLSHVVTPTLLASELGRPHLTSLLGHLTDGPDRRVLGAAGVGRVALLARASRREARFARIEDFFARQGVPPRTIASFAEIAEELVMNALYDAPLEAGFLRTAVPRTEDIELPHDRACEISYGIEDGNAFLRVRDTFGALTRDRLMEVLGRCSARGVALDTSRGGAGLGLWRVFSAASTISIHVIPGRLTDILVCIASRRHRLARQLQAVDLFFGAEANGSSDRASIDALVSQEQLDQSITLVRVA